MTIIYTENRFTKKRRRIDFFYILILLFGMIGLYVGVVNMYFWLILLVSRFFMSSKKEIGLFFLLFGSSLFGRMFASDTLVVYITIFFPLIGIILLRQDILRIIHSHRRSYWYLSILILFFALHFLFSDLNPYAQGKITRMIIRGYIWLTVFLIYFHTPNIGNRNFTYFLLILALFYLSQAYQLYNIRPLFFGDISFFRSLLHELGRNDLGTLIVNPHTLGYLACGAITFYLSKKGSLNGDIFVTISLSALVLLLVFISGTRQTIVSFVIIYFLAIILRGGKLRLKNFIIAIGVLLILVFIINEMSSSSEFINRMVSEENEIDERLHRDINTPFRVMEINPLTGVGFGEYKNHASKEYPHNMFLEIICEEGYLGLIVVLLISFFYLFPVLNRYGLSIVSYISINRVFPILLFTLFFLRAMISGDLSSSISVFAVLFSYTNYKSNASVTYHHG